MWEADKSWYNPSLHDANFLIQGLTSANGNAGPGMKSVLVTFGPPARQYTVDGVNVLVWNYNLLTRLHWGQRWPVFDPSDPAEDVAP
jgi:hypothetical protein